MHDYNYVATYTQVYNFVGSCAQITLQLDI